MTLLEKKKANRLMLDDTVPLICQIEGINKKEHVVCAFGSITDQLHSRFAPLDQTFHSLCVFVE